MMQMVPNIQPVCRSLRQLTLRECNLSDLAEQYFDGCICLTSIILTGNKLRETPNLFHVHKTLEKLIIPANNVVDISSLYSVQFPRLRVLDLQNNRIPMFPYPPWGFPKLRLLLLTGNRIQNISHTLLLKAPYNFIVVVNENLWHCDQELCWLRRHCILKPVEKTYKCGHSSIKTHKEGIACTSPARLRGLEISATGNVLIRNTKQIPNKLIQPSSS